MTVEDETRVEKLSEDEVRRTHRIAGPPAGGFYRIRETSNGVFLVEGTDLWGRTVSRHGADEHALLTACHEDPRQIDASR